MRKVRKPPQAVEEIKEKWQLSTSQKYKEDWIHKMASDWQEG